MALPDIDIGLSVSFVAHCILLTCKQDSNLDLVKPVQSGGTLGATPERMNMTAHRLLWFLTTDL